MTCHKVEKGVLLILLVSISVSRYTMRGNTVLELMLDLIGLDLRDRFARGLLDENGYFFVF